MIPGQDRRPVLVYFSEIKQGDVKKQRADSNISQSGGGARDERIRPVSLAEHLRPMFPVETAREGATEGDVYWVESDGSFAHATIELWRPTDARPDEGRLGKVHTIKGWTVRAEDLTGDLDHRTVWYYFLVQDNEERVWAFVMNDDRLRKEPSWLQDFVRERASKSSARNKVQGLIDCIQKKTYPL